MAPKTTEKHIAAGAAGSKRKRADARAKVQANADRVAEINAGRDDETLTRPAAVTYLKAHGLYAGRSQQTADQLRAAVREHQAMVRLAEEDAAKLAEPAPADDPMERYRLAKLEHKALQAWTKDGSRPPRPATPNLDALNGQYEAGGASKRKQAEKAEREPRSTSTNPRVRQSIDAASAGPRGAGRKVTDEEVADFIAAELKSDPTLTRSQCQQISWWVEGHACGIPRFNRIFDATVTKAA